MDVGFSRQSPSEFPREPPSEPSEAGEAYATPWGDDSNKREYSSEKKDERSGVRREDSGWSVEGSDNGSMSIGGSESENRDSAGASDFDRAFEERSTIQRTYSNTYSRMHKTLAGRADDISLSNDNNELNKPSGLSNVIDKCKSIAYSALKGMGIVLGVPVTVAIVVGGLATSPLHSLALTAMNFHSKRKNQNELRSVNVDLARNEALRSAREFESEYVISDRPRLGSRHVEKMERKTSDDIVADIEQELLTMHSSLEARRDVLESNIAKNTRNLHASLLFFIPVIGLLAAGSYLKHTNREAQGAASALIQSITPETKKKLAQAMFYPLSHVKTNKNRIADELEAKEDRERGITPGDRIDLKFREQNLVTAKFKLSQFEQDPKDGIYSFTNQQLKVITNEYKAKLGLRHGALLPKGPLSEAQVEEGVREYLKERVELCRTNLEDFILYGARYNHESIQISVDRGDGKDHSISAAVISAEIGKPVDYAKPTMVLFHANAQTLNSMWDRADFFRKQGFNVLTVTMGGYPGSDIGTKTSEASTYQDANAVMKHIRDLGADNICVYGVSIGGSLALAAADLHSEVVKCVIADQTFDNAVNVAGNLMRNGTKSFKSFFESIGKGAARGAFTKGEVVPGVFKKGLPYQTDGIDNSKKAESLKSTNCNLFVIKSDRDTFMGRNQQGEVFTEDFGLDLVSA